MASEANRLKDESFQGEITNCSNVNTVYMYMYMYLYLIHLFFSHAEIIIPMNQL